MFKFWQILKKLIGTKLSFFIIIVSFTIPYLLAFYPVSMSPDSVYQWWQAHNLNNLDSIHPFTYTFVIRIITFIWDSPVMVSILNIIFFAFVFSLGLNLFYRKGIPIVLLIVISILCSIVPTNGRMLTTFWKDVPFSIALLWYTIIFVQLLIDYEKFKNSKSSLIQIYTATCTIILFRHNGLLIGPILLFVLYFFYRTNKRQYFKVVASILATIAIVLSFGFFVLKAKKSDLGLHTMLARHIGSFVVNGKTDSTDIEILKKIQPIEVWKKNYHKYSIEGYYFGKEGPQFVVNTKKYKNDIYRLFIKLTYKSPKTLLRSEKDITELIWKIIPSRDSYSSLYCPAQKVVKFGFFRRILDRLTNITKSIKKPFYLRPIFWSGSLYNNIYFVIIIILLFTKYRNNLIILLPVLLNIFSLFISIPAQDYRYVYSSFLVFPIIVLFIYYSLANRKTESIENILK